MYLRPIRHIRNVGLIVVTIMVMALSVVAVPDRPPYLDKLTDESTLIVVAEATSIQRGIRSVVLEASELKSQYGIQISGPRISARVDRVSLVVNQVLKGMPPSLSLEVENFTPEDPLDYIGWKGIPDRAHGVFFFRKSVGGTLEFTDRNFPWVETFRGPLSVSDGATPVDRVINVLGASLANPGNHETYPILWLELTKNNVAVNMALRSVLAHPDIKLRLDAARALMYRGDFSGLGVIKSAFLPATQELPNNLDVTVPSAISFNLHDSKYIPDMEQLLASSVPMRRAAAEALSKMDSLTAASGLRKALGDADVEVRYYGAVGLAHVTGEEKAWRPSREQFKADENKYISHWKERLANQ